MPEITVPPTKPWRRSSVLFALALVAAGCASTGDGGVASSAPAATITSTSWDRGRITLDDGSVTEDWGVVAAPGAGGPHPVAVLLHGNSPTCPADTGKGRTWPCPAGTEVPNHEGLRYLADALAERGFVAIAPGINVQYTLGSGEPATAVRTAAIAERALDELQAGELGVPADLVDAERVVLIGHSIGGQDAGMLAAHRTSFEHPVSGVVMLQPALNDSQALPLVDVPAALVVSECDGDTGVIGGSYVAEALLDPRNAPAALVVLEHANHNFTNTGLRPDAFPVDSPGCTADRALGAADQQALLADIVPELAHATLGDGVGSGWAGDVFADPAAPAGVQIAVVDAGEPVAAVPGPGPTLPSGLETSGMAATFCPIGYSTPQVEPGTEACHRPELPRFVGLPQTVALSWTTPNSSFTAPIDAAAGDTVVLRALADPADPALTAEEIRLRVTTPEGADVSWVLPVPEHTREEISPFTITHALVMWSTLRIPVNDGATAVTVEVESPSAGSMQVVSIGAAGR